MRQTWRRSGTAGGDYVYFMTMDDLEGTLNVFISAEVYNRNSKVFSKDAPTLVEGTVEVSQSREEPTLRAEKVWRLVN
jgi:DNA polymerase III alpha subunit